MTSTLITDYIGRGLAAARPVSPPVATGALALYYATDTNALSVWNGSTWGAFAAVPGLVAQGLSAPLVGTFAWINQGGAAAANQTNGPMTLTAPAGAGNNFRFFGANVPGSAPWTATAEITANMAASSSHYAGLALSDGTKFTFFGFVGLSNTVGLYVQNWTNATTFSGTTFGNGWMVLGPAAFLRIYNDATNYNYQVSGDGITWTTVASVAVAAFLTATKVGFLIASQTAGDGTAAMNVFGYEAVTGTGTVLHF